MIARLAGAVGKTVLITAALVLALALVLTVAAFRILSWPYRSTVREKGPRAAQLEALAAIATAVVALVQAQRAKAKVDRIER